MKKEIAIFVNTFLRDELIPVFTKSCKKFVPNSKLYITDNGRMTTLKRMAYGLLGREGHFVEHKKEFNYWWRKSFNEKVSKTDGEKYILKIDDDFVFKNNSNIKKFIEILEKNPDIGLIGGQVWQDHRNEPSPYIYNVKEKEGDRYLLEYARFRGKEFIHCDFVPDFWLARKEIFDDIQMAEDMKPAQGGHEHFFRTIYEKRQSGEIDWKVAYTNEVIAFHEKHWVVHTDEYKRERSSGLKDYHKNIKIIRPGHEHTDRIKK